MADNIYTKIMKIRKEFSETEITKTGRNNYQKYDYLKLEDFVPVAIKLCNKYDVYTHVNIGMDGFATMSVVSTDDINDSVIYKLRIPELPTTEFKVKQEIPLNATTMIQDMGKLETYARRYLYYLFLDLAVPDEVDGGKPTNNNNSSTFNKSTFNSKRTDTPKKTLKQMNQEKQAKREEKQKKDNEKTPYETQTVTPRHKPRPLNTDLQTPDPEPLRTIINQVNNFLRNNGTPPTRKNIWIETMQRVKDGQIKKELKDDLQKYITSHCPEEL